MDNYKNEACFDMLKSIHLNGKKICLLTRFIDTVHDVLETMLILRLYQPQVIIFLLPGLPTQRRYTIASCLTMRRKDGT